MKRKGFTLVELLIVIVVIGILSTMIMMSSTEAVTSSRASNIVSNLRNLKAAALALYSDSIDTFITETDSRWLTSEVQKYLQKGTKISDMDKYTVRSCSGKWFVFYEMFKEGVGDAPDVTRLKAKIRGRAQSAGLFETDDNTKEPPLDTDTNEYRYYSNLRYIAMEIR